MLARACSLAAFATGAAWTIATLLETARGVAGARARAAAFLLPALLMLSLAVRFTGLGHEVEGRYYLDEGTYYHHASEINGGDVLRFSFVYPHLTYYADAFVLWLASLFPGVIARLAAGVYGVQGVQEPLGVSWLLLRGVVALLSALTVVPVFRIAERLGGRTAGALASLLLIFSPLYNEGSHLNTCDVPSAFFATLCLLFAARLVDGESTRDYLLAGVAAGLAAASKYPAGVVAVAIVAVWLRWRINRIASRNWSWGLLGAGLAALASFTVSMPSLLFFPRQALLGGRGIFFGARQYSQGGWLGVMPANNGLFYAQNLAWSFGVPVLLVGLAGLFLLSRDVRRRLLWLLPYPALYLILIASMNMVVRRNLYPMVPILTVFLGLGLAALLSWLRARTNAGAAKWLAPAAAALLLVLPLWRTAEQDVALSRPSTREVAADWIRAHVPPGATLVKESYTPNFQWHEYQVLQRRFAGRFAMEELRAPGNDYLLLASAAYGRFQQPERFIKPHHRELARVYQQVFSTFPLTQRWSQGRFRLGPELRLYRIPDPPDCAAADLPAAAAFVPDGRMRPRPKRPIQYTLEGQWAAFKGCFDAGRVRLTVRGEPAGPGQVEVAALDGQRLEKVDLKTAADRGVRLPRRGKYLFYIYLPVGSKVRGLTVERR